MFKHYKWNSIIKGMFINRKIMNDIFPIYYIGKQQLYRKTTKVVSPFYHFDLFIMHFFIFIQQTHNLIEKMVKTCESLMEKQRSIM